MHARLTMLPRLSRPILSAQSAWRYLQVSTANSTNRSAVDYDDSGWAVGPAPFGSFTTGGNPAVATAYDARFSSTFGTNWDLHTSLWIRKTLTLASVPPGGIRIVSFIEDNCLFYVNGTLILDSPDGPVGGNGQTFDIADSELVVGDNIIAVRCNDDGGALAYADFIIEFPPA